MARNKKAQNAASRKDVFYNRAKQVGYRARSAFKLVHLNNIHGLLKNAKVCLDLCAAPGSWMQVAREYMPTGSVIVGVDLFPIKPIPNTISLKGDITTDTLRTELRATLKEYKADIVLHDGAPNLGQNWNQDAYEQNLLVLHSFKLACEFLRYGGDFVTKVFRSKDSPSLEYVFKALFKTVVCNKPQSSRHESAEIFYVCRSFKLRTGDKADPKFFDPKEVFKEVESTLPSRINLQKPEKVSKKVMGYEDGAEVLYNEATITSFVESDHFEEVLQQANALVFDSERWSQHPSTTEELRECCKDIKVLGRKEIKNLINWRKQIRAELDAERKLMSQVEKEAAAQPAVPLTPEEAEKEEMERVQKQINEIESSAMREDKKKQQAVKKQQRVLQQKLKMMAMSGNSDVPRDDEFFSIKQMEKVVDTDALIAQYDASDSETEKKKGPKYIKFRPGDFELDDDGKHYRRVGEISDSDSDDELPEVGSSAGLFKKGNLKKVDGIEVVPKEDMAKKHKKAIRFADGTAGGDSDDTTTDDDDEDFEKDVENEETDFRDSGVGGEEDESDEEGEQKGEKLTTDLVGDIAEDKMERTAEHWFSKELDDLEESDVDMDFETDAAVALLERLKEQAAGETDQAKEDELEGAAATTTEAQGAEEKLEEDQPAFTKGAVKRELQSLKALLEWMDEHQDAFPGNLALPSLTTAPTEAARALVPDLSSVDLSRWGDDLFLPADPSKGSSEAGGSTATLRSTGVKRLPDLDAVGLAIATKLIQSKKAKRDLTLQGWNRYMKGEEPGLPQWFVEDESKNLTPFIDVNEEDVSYYTARERAVNARTLKKVMEAKVRKQRRFKKTMQNVLKKTEAMQGSSLMSDFEKQQEIKNLYKKAMKTRVKKGKEYVVMTKKNQGKKPKGIKGKYKMVDSRLKSDVRAKLKQDKKKKTFGRKGGKKH